MLYSAHLDHNGSKIDATIECGNCPASISGKTDEECITFWNSRQQQPADVGEALNHARELLLYLQPLIQKAGVPPMAQKIGVMRGIATSGAHRITHTLKLIETALTHQPAEARGDVVVPDWNIILKPEYACLGDILSFRISLSERLVERMLSEPIGKLVLGQLGLPCWEMPDGTHRRLESNEIDMINKALSALSPDAERVK